MSDPNSNNPDSSPKASQPTPVPPKAEEQPELVASARPAFDIDALRFDASFEQRAGIERPLVTVPVRKPNRHEFVRVHPDADMAIDLGLLRLKDDRDEHFLIAPSMYGALQQELRPTRLYLVVSTAGVAFVWPIALPRADGKTDPWSESAMICAEMAKSAWTSCRSNTSLGAYEPFVATADYGKAAWPKKPLAEILEIAFRGRIIDSAVHPIFLRLQGRS